MVRKRSRIRFSGPLDTKNILNFRYFGTTLGFLFLEGFFLVDGWRRRGHALQITNKKTSALKAYLPPTRVGAPRSPKFHRPVRR